MARKKPTAPAGESAGSVEPMPLVPDPAPPALDKYGLPARDLNGRPNPEYYRSFYSVLNRTLLGAVIDGGKIPFNYESAIAGVDKEAKASGFEPRILRDQRKPEHVIADALLALKDSPDDIWTAIDETIDVLESVMDAADKGEYDQIDKRIRDSFNPKAWLRRLHRVRRLRNRARNQTDRETTRRFVPNKTTGQTPETRAAYKDRDVAKAEAAQQAAWPLRLMAYVGRSNDARLANGQPCDSVYRFAQHHVNMAFAAWEARHNISFGPPIDDPRGDPWFWRDEMNPPYKGVILVCPMGHGKTDLGRFIVASIIAENPHTQALLNHAVSEKASENLAYLASLFKPTTPPGKRFFSLFGMELDQCNTRQFRLKLDAHHKSPTASAAGVSSAVLGANASVQWWDDPVNQNEADQETDRKRTFTTLNGRWLTRFRGSKGTFLLITATLWHNADAVALFIRGAKKSGYRVSIQRCGGPKSSPPFHALWPEMYPPLELRRIYDTMRNPSLYSAAYMSNPLADERRLVKELRLYDPNTEQHARFMESSAKYLSLDPTATRNARSDLAGVLYAGFGSVAVEKMVNGHQVHATERRLRFVEAQSIAATQSELVEYVVNLAKVRSVDRVYVETRSAFQGIAEMFENYHGITVYRLDPKNKDKGERLKAAAPALENANANLGLHAVVEFPGWMNPDGKWEIDPRFRELQEQILNFGVAPRDDQLDACTQLVIDLSPELGIGTGGDVTRQAQKVVPRGDPRLNALLAQWEKKKDAPRSQEASEDQWIRETWRMPRHGVDSMEWAG